MLKKLNIHHYFDALKAITVRLPVLILQLKARSTKCQQQQREKKTKNNLRLKGVLIQPQQPEIKGCFNSAASPEVVSEGPRLRNQSQKQATQTSTMSVQTQAQSHSSKHIDQPHKVSDTEQDSDMEYKYIIRKEEFEKKSTAAKLDTVFHAVIQPCYRFSPMIKKS